jgi:putative sugar O-methyltransferase
VLSDLKHLFGSLDNLNVIEIGVGYGGQCKVISDFFKPNKYYLVDLEEALNLADKYLKKLNVKNVEIVKPLDVNALDNQFDLIISNYAFTELSRSTQELYLNKILLRSSHGYITSNFVSREFNINSYSSDELMNKLNTFNLRTLEEIPLTHKDNIIYFW